MFDKGLVVDDVTMVVQSIPVNQFQYAWLVINIHFRVLFRA